MRPLRLLQRRVRRQSLVLLAASLISAPLFAGCGPQASAPDGTPESAADTASDSKSLRMLYWQAPTTLNPHLSTGIKDNEASRLVLEPLASYNEAEELEPILAAEIPTLENGGLSDDDLSVTWTLREGVVWSDGELLSQS